jgi:hypothetical protein
VLVPLIVVFDALSSIAEIVLELPDDDALRLP